MLYQTPFWGSFRELQQHMDPSLTAVAVALNAVAAYQFSIDSRCRAANVGGVSTEDKMEIARMWSCGNLWRATRPQKNDRPSRICNAIGFQENNHPRTIGCIGHSVRAH